ncbi:LacI family DNA-binding transcriptional regulator [Saccharophagus degradans]|uniref:Transcriptional regulator, LacI family n=2 Tax=Saccharophagus degradans TaxID=86304 RepID=Q21MY1_SACD2|nr:LacI family DNA-binding transcriptional regulator [Saccharophagus degradans]ABD79948.1 transcriptional regulator, LacI family [Saccharophagus degradans 2-40]MDO6422262.1 LacI family DNA-binding transcriptional regulator [Saccharophagus degradans]MDO6607463.1 LacI family DNA-binding transcriptional regulator [Saccharophagus degradans]
MATIKDVARVAGVSTATVSRVVHNGGQVGDACRARVKKVIAELGYRPNTNARALVSKKSDTLGVVTPRLSMTFFGTLAAGVENAARENSYKLLMSNSLYETETELEAIESLREHSCNAIILHSEYSDEKTLQELARQVPGLVLINRFLPSMANRCVWLDNVAGGKKITEYLIERGHKQFAVVTSVYQNNDPQSRLTGVKEALKNAGLKMPANNIVESTANMRGGEEAVQELLKRGAKFTAVVAYNDLMAVGAMNALQDAGIRVPEDVSVVGFDDLYITRACRPKLTTMSYPIEEMANYAAKLAIDLSTNPSNVQNRTHLFMPELIERNSVADIS